MERMTQEDILVVTNTHDIPTTFVKCNISYDDFCSVCNEMNLILEIPLNQYHGSEVYGVTKDGAEIAEHHGDNKTYFWSR